MNKISRKVNFFLIIKNLIKQNVKVIIFFALIIPSIYCRIANLFF